MPVLSLEKYLFEGETLIFASLGVSEKTLVPNFFTPAPILTVVRREHFSNIPSPTIRTELGIVIVVNWHCENAKPSISVMV